MSEGRSELRASKLIVESELHVGKIGCMEFSASQKYLGGVSSVKRADVTTQLGNPYLFDQRIPIRYISDTTSPQCPTVQEGIYSTGLDDLVKIAASLSRQNFMLCSQHASRWLFCILQQTIIPSLSRYIDTHLVAVEFLRSKSFD